jgi:hypothetical protein
MNDAHAIIFRELTPLIYFALVGASEITYCIEMMSYKLFKTASQEYERVRLFAQLLEISPTEIIIKPIHEFMYTYMSILVILCTYYLHIL